ncbi:hypothetical protein CTRI78_v003514 [Colletotrichum trifolii]|uniref:Secreted protein n=1 Tax=Colletotrichum trifolii TaxID=5466 RepID=A0A4R8RJ86_COLTR|nr:hypothetical protein CTRI78_v003514 [Colletotrichum trifolii]
MKLTVLLTLASSLTSTLAAVARSPQSLEAEVADTSSVNPPYSDVGQFFKRECVKEITKRGKCDGNSCKFGVLKYQCRIGTCDGEGYGDGSCCGYITAGNHVRCPNGGWDTFLPKDHVLNGDEGYKQE